MAQEGKPLPINGDRLLVALDLIEAFASAACGVAAGGARTFNLNGAWRNNFRLFRQRSSKLAFEMLYHVLSGDTGLKPLHTVLRASKNLAGATFDFATIISTFASTWATSSTREPVLDIVRAIASGELTEEKLAQ